MKHSGIVLICSRPTHWKLSVSDKFMEIVVIINLLSPRIIKIVVKL